MERHFLIREFRQADGVLLVAVRPEDAGELWTAIVRDRRYPHRRNTWPGFDSVADVEKYLVEASRPGGAEIAYFIRDAASGALAGTLHVFNVAPRSMSVEIGYSVCVEFEGQGYVSRALKLLERHLLALGFREMRITCPRWNVRSQRVALRAGFERSEVLQCDLDCLGCDECEIVFRKSVR